MESSVRVKEMNRMRNGHPYKQEAAEYGKCEVRSIRVVLQMCTTNPEIRVSQSNSIDPTSTYRQF